MTVPETDKIVELAAEVRGVYGSRMTGGGFGGERKRGRGSEREGEKEKRERGSEKEKKRRESV